MPCHTTSAIAPPQEASSPTLTVSGVKIQREPPSYVLAATGTLADAKMLLADSRRTEHPDYENTGP